MPVRRAEFDEQQLLERLATEQPVGRVIPKLGIALREFVANPDRVSVFTYQRMLETDETVGFAVDLLILSIAARMGQYQHPSQEVTDFVHASFESMRGSMLTVLREILSAKWAGFSVSEIVYAFGQFNQRAVWSWQRIVTLPPGTIAFEIDELGEVTDEGILQFDIPLRRTAQWLMDTARAVPDALAGGPNLPWPERLRTLYGNYRRIPKRKVIHFATGSPRFGNPYGRSPLRRAYKSWLMKDTILRMLLTMLDRKGTPLLRGTAPDREITLFDASGQRLVNTSGDPEKAHAQHLLMKALENVHQETAIVTGPEEDGYKVEGIQVGPTRSEFIDALGYLNRAIIRSLLLPNLVMEEGQRSGSFALGKKHSDTFQLVIDAELDELQTVVLEQLIRPLVVLNFGDLPEGWGEFLPVPMTIDEKQTLVEVVDSLAATGFISPSLREDWEAVRSAFEFPTDEALFSDFEADLEDEEDEPAEGEPGEGEPAGRSGASRVRQDRARMQRVVQGLLPELGFGDVA